MIPQKDKYTIPFGYAHDIEKLLGKVSSTVETLESLILVYVDDRTYLLGRIMIMLPSFYYVNGK